MEYVIVGAIVGAFIGVVFYLAKKQMQMTSRWQHHLARI